jgi:hypothetical protein
MSQKKPVFGQKKRPQRSGNRSQSGAGFLGKISNYDLILYGCATATVIYFFLMMNAPLRKVLLTEEIDFSKLNDSIPYETKVWEIPANMNQCDIELKTKVADIEGYEVPLDIEIEEVKSDLLVNSLEAEFYYATGVDDGERWVERGENFKKQFVVEKPGQYQASIIAYLPKQPSLVDYIKQTSPNADTTFINSILRDSIALENYKMAMNMSYSSTYSKATQIHDFIKNNQVKLYFTVQDGRPFIWESNFDWLGWSFLVLAIVLWFFRPKN